MPKNCHYLFVNREQQTVSVSASPKGPLQEPPPTENVYETVPQKSPTETVDNALLLTPPVVSDGPSSQQSREEPNDQEQSLPTAPPPAPDRSTHSPVPLHMGTTYTDIDIAASNTSPPPPASDNVVYHEVQGLPNPQVWL